MVYFIVPYLNTKYFFTEENNDFIGVYLIQSIRSFLEQPSEIPESLVYVCIAMNTIMNIVIYSKNIRMIGDYLIN